MVADWEFAGDQQVSIGDSENRQSNTDNALALLGANDCGCARLRGSAWAARAFDRSRFQRGKIGTTQES
jgi:hypothetical protein